MPTSVPGGRKKGDPDEPDDHAPGRSRGGFSTKLHIICAGDGTPLSIVLSPGQTRETQLFEELWNQTEISDPTLQHFVQPDALAGHKAYRSAAIIDPLKLQGVEAVIPEKGTKAIDADNPDFDHESYRRRNVIERLISRFNEFRRIFSRFEKTAVNYLGMIRLACIRMYLARLGQSLYKQCLGSDRIDNVQSSRQGDSSHGSLQFVPKGPCIFPSQAKAIRGCSARCADSTLQREVPGQSLHCDGEWAKSKPNGLGAVL